MPTRLTLAIVHWILKISISFEIQMRKLPETRIYAGFHLRHPSLGFSKGKCMLYDQAAANAVALCCNMMFCELLPSGGKKTFQ